MKAIFACGVLACAAGLSLSVAAQDQKLERILLAPRQTKAS